MVREPLHLLVIFLGMVLVAVGLERRFAAARKVSPVLMILFMGALLSNTGILVETSPFYEELIDLAVPLSVCLVLFTVRLNDLRKVGPGLLAAFVLACLGTFLGVLSSGLLLAPLLDEVVSGEGWKLAGPFAATYVGGSLNFFALWSGLDIGHADLFGAANAVDNLTLFPLFAIWILLPDLLGRRYPVAAFWRNHAADTAEEGSKSGPTPFRIFDVVALVFTAVLVVVASGLLKKHWIAGLMPDFPTILLITTLALALAQVPAVSRLAGARELGNLGFYLFFCAVGAMINLYQAVTLSPVLFLYVMVIVAVHMVVVYGLGRVLYLDVRALTVASAAAKAGPASVVALANVKGWKPLLVPGVALGLLGYAIGNYLGFAAAYAMRGLLGD